MRTSIRQSFSGGRALWAPLMGIGLLSLVFIGSPGCGCGDTLPGGTSPSPCCCDFVWFPEPFLQGSSVDIVPVASSGGLEFTILPTVLTGVDQGEASEFTVCVPSDHPLGASVSLEFRDSTTSTVYGSVTLVYNRTCVPTILPGVRTPIYSPDCGQVPPCCCPVEWFNIQTAGPLLDIRIQFANVDPGLNPTANPSTIDDVGPGEIALFDVCVSLTHPLGASMTVQIVDANTNTVIGEAFVDYDARCEPNLLDTTGQGVWTFVCQEE